MSQKFNPLSGQFDTVLDKAEEIAYDNAVSGLTATDVQTAVDELDNIIDTMPDPITYAGTWSAATNTPTLANTDTGVTGFLYRVTAAGTVNFGAGNISFDVGDSVVNNGTVWEKWDHSDQVLSVNSQTGAVVLDTDDIGEGATNLYFTDSRAQGAITGGASSITTSNLTANRALESNGTGKVAASSITSTELSYLSGASSNLQTQLNNKISWSTPINNNVTVATDSLYSIGANGGQLYKMWAQEIHSAYSAGLISETSYTQLMASSAGGGWVEINDWDALAAIPLRFYTAGGSNYVALVAPASATDTTYTLPSADGSANQVLKTNGSGTLSWTTVPGLPLSVSTKTGTYNATTSDDLILCDASSAGFTINLYAASGNSGRVIRIKKTDSTFNAITIDGNASETIDGSTTTTLNTQNETIILVCDGSNWQILDRRIPSIINTYTMVVTGSGANPTKASSPTLDRATWSREGKYLNIYYEYAQTATTGAANGTGAYIYSIPSGITIDSSYITTSTEAGKGTCGTGNAMCGSGLYLLTTEVYSSTTLSLKGVNPSDASGVRFDVGAASGTGFANNAVTKYNFMARVPISGWNG